MKIEYIKDIAGNNYLGIKIDSQLVYLFLKEMKLHLTPADFEEYRKLQSDRDSGHFHITIINVMELNQLISKFGMDKVTEAIQKWQAIDFHPQLMGIGSATKNTNRTFFVVVNCNPVQILRTSWGLEEKDLHITLGFKYKDVHGVPKNKVLERPNPFFNEIKSQWLAKENWDFIRKIGNYNASSVEEIIPYQLTKSYLKVVIGSIHLQIGYLEDSNKLWVMAQWNDPQPVTRLSISEIISFLKD